MSIFGPLLAFNFHVALFDTKSPVDIAISTASLGAELVFGGGFTECTGLDGSMLVEDYIQGGQNQFVHKFPTRITYGNISLKRGMTTLSDGLWLWHDSYVQGKGKRRDGLILLKNEAAGIPVKAWIFKEALPVKWTGPTLVASQNAVAIETLELAHHGVQLVSPHAVGSQIAEGLGL